MSISIISALSKASLTAKYKTNNYSFPSYEKIDPALKQQPEYCAQIAQAGYSALMRDKTAIPSGSYEYIQMLRDYGTGNQSPLFYQNKIKENEVGDINSNPNLSTGAGSSKRKGVAGLNEKIISIATNLKNGIHGMLEEYEEDIFVNAIDNESGAEEEMAMFEAMFDTEASPFIKMMDEQYNVPLANDSIIPEDASTEEIVSYKESGGFKTFWAEKMEEVIKHTEEFSKWNRVIKRKFIDDAIDINFLSGRCLFDTASSKDKWGYVDPDNFCIQYSDDNMFEDAEYAGCFTLEKVASLVEKGFDSEKIIAAAKNFSGQFENPTDMDWGTYISTNNFDQKLFGFKVPVFHFSWIDVDVKKQDKYTNKYGKVSISDIGFNEKRNGARNEPLNTRRKRAYQCSWIVDSDMVYDYGLVPNQSGKLPFFAWRGISTNRKMIFGSIIESIVPFLDHLHMSWLKYQDSLAKSHPGGYAINLRLLQNLQFGGKKLDPLDAFKMFWETGRFPYMDVPMGENYKGGAVLPVSRIEGDAGALMSVFEHQIQFVSAMIEKLTGINPLSMGVTPDKDSGLGVQQMASAGTNNVIRPIINGIFEMKEKLATETSQRVPLLCRNIEKTRKALSRIIGKEGVDVIVNAERSGAEYGLFMEARPGIEEKNNLIQMVQEALKLGRDGEASITLPQGMYILERINNGGNFKKLQRQVDFMIRKSKEEVFAQKRALIAEQSQQQGQQKQAEQQGEMQMKQIDHKMNVDIEDVKFKHELAIKQAEANLDYENKLREKKLELMSTEEKVLV